MAEARSAGATVSYDTNFRPRLWTAAQAWPVIKAAAAAADIVKTSSEDCAALIGLTEPQAIADHILSLGAPAVLVTLGRDGVLLADRSGSENIPGYPLEAIDATGAGDAFTGAMLAELAAGRPLREAARFGNAAAALSTLGYGAIAPLPRRSAVEALLSRQ
jgi:2-dehydro-3-deoxygluconokinase